MNSNVPQQSQYQHKGDNYTQLYTTDCLTSQESFLGQRPCEALLIHGQACSSSLWAEPDTVCGTHFLIIYLHTTTVTSCKQASQPAECSKPPFKCTFPNTRHSDRGAEQQLVKRISQHLKYLNI